MTHVLRRFQESGQSHFVTFSCCRRQPYFATPEMFDQFVRGLEDMRRRFELCIYGYVVMAQHVHLLLSEPPQARLAEAIHDLKLSFAKRMRSLRPEDQPGSFWQKRYYDRNVRDAREFTVKLRYLHRNPVKRGLVKNPEIGNGAASGTMHCGRKERSKSSPTGRQGYNQHDVGSFSESLGLFIATNLLAATSQRRYPIKRSRFVRNERTSVVEGPCVPFGGSNCNSV